MSAGPEKSLLESSIEAAVIEVLRTVRDPELPVNIVDMGLIYGIDVNPEGEVTVRMTLTTPACPAAGSLPAEVQAKALGVDGVTACDVRLVWDPPWTPQRMSEAARLEAGLL
jgi:FeS assembly SUF system protein